MDIVAAVPEPYARRINRERKERLDTYIARRLDGASRTEAAAQVGIAAATANSYEALARSQGRLDALYGGCDA